MNASIRFGLGRWVGKGGGGGGAGRAPRSVGRSISSHFVDCTCTLLHSDAAAGGPSLLKLIHGYKSDSGDTHDLPCRPACLPACYYHAYSWLQISQFTSGVRGFSSCRVLNWGTAASLAQGAVKATRRRGSGTRRSRARAKATAARYCACRCGIMHMHM